MEISRDYVKTDSLEAFPIKDRLFKLPIDSYVSKIKDDVGNPISLIPIQVAMVNMLQDPRHKFCVFAVARRTGKTALVNWVASILSFEPHKHILIISPNFSLSSISFEWQLNLLRTFGIETSIENKKDRIIELRDSRSTIRMTSVNQASNALGRSYDFILVDEAAIDNKMGAEWFALRPCLDKKGAKAAFISTPRGGEGSYFHDFYQKGFDDQFPEWASLHGTWEDNPRIDMVGLDEARRSLSKNEFKQEFEASFTNVEGQIFEYDDDNIIDFDKDYRDKVDIQLVVGGIDTGFKDPTCMVVIYLSDDTIFVVDEYREPELTTAQHAKNLHYIVSTHDVDMIYADPSNAQMRSDLFQIYDLPTITAKKDLLEGIDYVVSLLQHKKLLIDKSCKMLLNSMLLYRWNPNEALIKPKPLHTGSDLCDSLRYAVYNSGPGNLEPLYDE